MSKYKANRTLCIHLSDADHATLKDASLYRGTTMAGVIRDHLAILRKAVGAPKPKKFKTSFCRPCDSKVRSEKGKCNQCGEYVIGG